MTSRLNAMPAWARWMIYAAAGVLLLTIVQSISDTERLMREIADAIESPSRNAARMVVARGLKRLAEVMDVVGPQR